MNTEEDFNNQAEWATCVVCENSVVPARGAVRINHRGNTINLCGPQCLRRFAEEPDAYLARMAKIMRDRATKTEIPCL
jgi:YHS domain-containing protein